jgi:membrane protease YdiL (CAAX protease family)
MHIVPLQKWRPITSFFLIAYLISWSAWIALFSLHYSHLAGTGLYLYLVAIFAPHASAVVVTVLERGFVGLGTFYGRVFRRAPVVWIVAATVVPMVIYLTPGLVAMGLQLPRGPLLHQPPRTLSLLVLGFLAIALGEEPGWRGFALPSLTRKVGAIGASLVLGVAWSLWHLPLFIIAGTAQYGTPFVPFLITLTAWSLIVTWLVVRAGGSVVVAMLFHISANLCDFTVWQPESWSLALCPWIVAALITVWLMRGDSRHPE